MERLRTRLRPLRLRRKMTPEMKARQALVEEAIRGAGNEGLAASDAFLFDSARYVTGKISLDQLKTRASLRAH
ncbi:hypothetical protein ACIPYU_19630 [Paenarthrobacter nicotinovorans]|uniref:antitoxin VbhA family protein n=1 Tax=Paenarthrobacter nicotinovorans TaxID=29320 RepID=UPI0037FCE975